MSTIKVLVNEQSLRVINGPKIASRGVNENVVEFTFDESWDGFGKTAIFYKEFHEENVYQSIIDSDGIASVPHEATDTECKMCFGVVGIKGNVIYTTEVIKYNIVKGVPISGSESEPPSPTIYQQMLSLVGQVQSDVDSFESDTNDRLDVMSSQMDEFIAEHAGTYGETVLWDSDNASGETISGNTQTVTLSEDCSGYDYIDIHFGDYVRTNTGIDFVNHIQTFFKPDYDNKEVSLLKWQFGPASNDSDGIHFKITYHDISWSWSGNAIDDAVNFGTSHLGWPIDKIVGRKLVADAELVDARVGVDGTVYQTVGAAIRGQINDVAGGTVELDTTLTQQGKAADAKAVGDKIGQVKADLVDLQEGGYIADAQQIQTKINAWLADHPEATTTVQNGSLTETKFSNALKLKTIKDYVTPEMFGAVGDGVADDTIAIQNALNSGAVLCIAIGSYKITDVISVSSVRLYGGKYFFYSSARLDLTNAIIDSCEFDFTNLIRTQITGVYSTGGNNAVVGCKFGEITASESAKHIYMRNCRVVVKKCEFEEIKLTTINNIIGDDIGTARHITADTCDIVIDGNSFSLFNGTNDNYLEDSDGIHLRYCTNRAIVCNNSFTGYAKSCIKVQYGNADIYDNHINLTGAMYGIRWHDNPLQINIVNNIFSGDIGIVFYAEGADRSIVCGNNVNTASRILLYIDNGKVVFNDNHCTITEGTSYNARPLSVYRVKSCTVYSNSIVESVDAFQPYHTTQGNTVDVHFTGTVITTYTGVYNLYGASGEINGLLNVTVNGGTNLDINGENVSLVNCSGISGKIKVSNSYLIIKTSSNVILDILAVSRTSYAVRVNALTNAVLNLFGSITSSNIIAVEDGSGSSGVIINYASDKTGIYDVAGSGVSFVAKTMLA